MRIYCSAGTTIKRICRVLLKESEDTKENHFIIIVSSVLTYRSPERASDREKTGDPFSKADLKKILSYILFLPRSFFANSFFSSYFETVQL